MYATHATWFVTSSSPCTGMPLSSNSAQKFVWSRFIKKKAPQRLLLALCFHLLMNWRKTWQQTTLSTFKELVKTMLTFLKWWIRRVANFFILSFDHGSWLTDHIGLYGTISPHSSLANGSCKTIGVVCLEKFRVVIGYYWFLQELTLAKLAQHKQEDYADTISSNSWWETRRQRDTNLGVICV